MSGCRGHPLTGWDEPHHPFVSPGIYFWVWFSVSGASEIGGMCIQDSWSLALAPVTSRSYCLNQEGLSPMIGRGSLLSWRVLEC